MTSAQPVKTSPLDGKESLLEDQHSPAIGKSDYQLFGTVGRDTYLRYQPVVPNDAGYAVKQIQERYADTPENHKAIDSRLGLWKNYERLKSEFDAACGLPAVETIFQLLKEISPLAKSQLDGQRSGLGLHLLEVTEFCKSFFQNDSGASRFPTLINDRHAALMSEVIAPLHDALKYLGAPDSQIMPDHEILTAELVRKHFVERLVVINGREDKLTHEDVEFIAGVIGDHENINKELGRSNWIDSRNEVERAKALFFVADTLTGALREVETGSNQWKFDSAQLDQRFIDLYFRHIDPVKGKIFRPEWALHAVADLSNTLDRLGASGCSIAGMLPDQSPRETLIESAIEGINRSLSADAARWSAAHTAGVNQPDKFLSNEQLSRIDVTLAALNTLKAQALKDRLKAN